MLRGRVVLPGAPTRGGAVPRAQWEADEDLGAVVDAVQEGGWEARTAGQRVLVAGKEAMAGEVEGLAGGEFVPQVQEGVIWEQGVMAEGLDGLAGRQEGGAGGLA
ncbi:MAG: hypothetical protein WDW38_006134 [Sanguina aurantia]